MKKNNKPDKEDYETLEINVKHANNAEILIAFAHLSSGLEYVISAIKPGEISKKARKELTTIIREQYSSLVARLAENILRNEGKIKEDEQRPIFFRFDFPEKGEDKLIIYYKFHS